MELKPCPFCGGEAKFTRDTDGGAEDWGPSEFVYIKCSQCGVKTQKEHSPSTGYEIFNESSVLTYGKKQLAEIWNKRVCYHSGS